LRRTVCRWCGRYSVPLDNVADGLVADDVTEVRESADDSVAAAGSVLGGEADDQVRDFLNCPGGAGGWEAMEGARAGYVKEEGVSCHGTMCW
jgi:hypothetical protein